jgi:hypothetical protein
MPSHPTFAVPPPALVLALLAASSMLTGGISSP